MLNYRIARSRVALFAVVYSMLITGDGANAAQPAATAAKPQAAPNIVLIISDDQAWTDYARPLNSAEF